MAWIAGAAAVVGAGSGLLSTIMSYQQQLIALSGQSEQLGFQNELLDQQLSMTLAQNNAQLTQLSIQEQLALQQQDIQHDVLDSQARVLEAQQKALQIKMQERGKIFTEEQKQLTSKSRQENIQQSIFKSQQRQTESQIRETFLNDRKMRVTEALQKNDIKTARAEATKAARVESAQVKMLNAAGGASAFSRAYSQMSVNSLASADQKLNALEQEGLINRQVMQENVGRLGEQIQQSQAQVASSQENQKQLAYQKNINAAEYRTAKAEDSSQFTANTEALVQNGLSGDLLDAQVDAAVATFQSQQGLLEFANANAEAQTNTQQTANEAAQENIADQQDAMSDPASGMGWNDSEVGKFGEQVSGVVDWGVAATTGQIIPKGIF